MSNPHSTRRLQTAMAALDIAGRLPGSATSVQTKAAAQPPAAAAVDWAAIASKLNSKLPSNAVTAGVGRRDV